MADFPRNRDLVSKEARKYNKKLKEQHVVDSFPAIIVVDGKENVLGERALNSLKLPQHGSR